MPDYSKPKMIMPPLENTVNENNRRFKCELRNQYSLIYFLVRAIEPEKGKENEPV